KELFAFFPVGSLPRVVAALIPDHDSTRSIVSLRDDPFKVTIFQGMILNHYSQTFVVRIKRRSFWDGPAFKSPIQFKTEIKVQASGLVHLNDKSKRAEGRTAYPQGFRGLIKVTLFLILLETHKCDSLRRAISAHGLE